MYGRLKSRGECDLRVYVIRYEPMQTWPDRRAFTAVGNDEM